MLAVSVVFTVGSLSAREVVLKFTVVAVDLGETVKLGNGTEVLLSKRYPSDALKVDVGDEGNLPVYAGDADPADEAAVPLCVVKIGKEVKEANVVLVPKKGGEGCRAIVLDYAKFKGGGVCFFNASDAPVGVMLDEENLRVKPGSMEIYNSKVKNPKNVSVLMASVHRDGAVNDVFHKGEWRLVPTSREIMVIYKHPKIDKIKVRGIVDY